MPASVLRRPLTTRLSITTTALLFAGLVLVAPQSASAAVLQPVPDGVYLATPWVEPGGEFTAFFVGSTTECGTGGGSFTKSWSFVGPGGSTPLQVVGAGGDAWMGYSIALLDGEGDPLPIGQSSPVSGQVVLSCAPSGGGAAQTLSMDLTVSSAPPSTIYNSPTAWTWYTPGSAGVGSVVTINALGFKPGETTTLSFVNMDLFSIAGEWSGAVAGPITVVADGEGAVTGQVAVPEGWTSGDSVQIVAAGETSKYLLQGGSGSPLEGDATIAVSSTSGAFPGSAVSIAASGFVPGETVVAALHGATGRAIELGAFTANSSGAVSGVAYLPSSLTVGSYRLWLGASEISFLLLNAPLDVGAVPSTERLSGADRFQTAVAISQQSFSPGVDTVYIASGLNFPDALSAGALAAQKGAPVLLTHPDMLMDPVRAELIRLQPDRIVLVGGTPSVSSAVKAALEALPFDPAVDRIAGTDRFATNRLLVDDALNTATTVFIATGLKFPDALAAAPAAAEGGGAVILVNGGASALDSATVALLQSLNVVDVRIVGDPASVSTQIENQLKSLYPGHVQRFAGADRFATAAKIVSATWPDGATEAILASGVNFPDALAASALGQPMLTSLPTCIPGVVLAELANLQPTGVTLVGDAKALSTAVKNFTHC